MTTTTYTVYSPASGTEYGRGLSAVEAAHIVLGHDGHDYELRSDDEYPGCYQLFVSRLSRNASGGNFGLTEAWSGRKLIRAYADNEAAAWEKIAAQVIAAGWERLPQAMPDAEYDAMLAG